MEDNKIKKLSFILLILIISFITINFEQLIASAKTYVSGEENINNVFKTGDKYRVDIYQLYANQNYGITIEYYNKDDELQYLMFYREQHPAEGDFYAEIARENEYEESYLETLYDKDQDFLDNTESWVLIEEGNERISKICNQFSDNEINNYDIYFCEDYPNLESYTLKFKEYTPPEFEFNCDPQTISYLNTTTCKLEVNTTSNISEITAEVNSEDLTIENAKAKDGWNLTKENNVFTISTFEPFYGKDTLLEVTLKANNNVNKESKVNLKNISYTDPNGNKTTTDLSSNVQVNILKSNNPRTYNTMNFALIISIIIISSYILILYIYKKKELNY